MLFAVILAHTCHYVCINIGDNGGLGIRILDT